MRVRPPPLAQAPLLCRTGTGNAQHPVKFFLGRHFKEQGNHHHRPGPAFVAPLKTLRVPALANARMKDGFEFTASRWVSEDAFRQPLTPETSFGVNHLGTEADANFRQGGLTGFDHLAGQEIAVGYRPTGLTKQTTQGRFAHADTAGESEQNQGLTKRKKRLLPWGTPKMAMFWLSKIW